MSKKQYHHGNLKPALIQAGVDLLAEEGAQALSLRKVAARAGVSHSAPYAHFADKQAMLAAVSAEGFRRLYLRLHAAAAPHVEQPRQMLLETAYAYLCFATENQASFKLMFSGILEDEHEHPDFIASSGENFGLLIDLVRRCQAAGLLRPAPPELAALSLWSLVHGFTALLLEGQIPGQLVTSLELKELLRQALNQVTVINI